MRRRLARRTVTGHRVGEHHHRARYSDEDVMLMRALAQYGLSYGQIARKFEAPRSTVRDIVTYRRRVL